MLGVYEVIAEVQVGKIAMKIEVSVIHSIPSGDANGRYLKKSQSKQKVEWMPNSGSMKTLL
jgi:hypothetical protein